MLSKIENLKLKLVTGFEMPKQEFRKDPSGGKGSFHKVGNEMIQMYELTFVQQDELKSSITFNVKENTFNKFEETGEIVDIFVDLGLDPFTKKLRFPKLVGVVKGGTEHPNFRNSVPKGK